MNIYAYIFYTLLLLFSSELAANCDHNEFQFGYEIEVMEYACLNGVRDCHLKFESSNEIKGASFVGFVLVIYSSDGAEELITKLPSAKLGGIITSEIFGSLNYLSRATVRAEYRKENDPCGYHLKLEAGESSPDRVKT